MRKRAFGILLLAAVAGAQDEQSIAARFLAAEEEAFAHFRLEKWDEAIAAFERQIAIFAENPRPYYNIACAYARQGKAERAATWLRLSIARGWRDIDHLRQDPDFDGVRDTAAFKTCVAELQMRRADDPEPQPRAVALSSVPGAASAQSILAATAIQEQFLARQELLLADDQYRRRLFRLYDRRMAMLTRYLTENGDSKDAHEAAHARVQTAMLYLARAADSVQPVAAKLVQRTAADFERGWAGSPLLHEVRFWRAHAAARLGKTGDAETQLRSLLKDHPHSGSAPRALVELCVMLADQNRRDDLRRDYLALRDRFGRNRAVQLMMRERLMKARLFVEGIPQFFDLDETGKVRAAAAGDRTVAYLFVSVDDTRSQTRLEALRKVLGTAHLVVVSVDAPGRVPPAQVDAWFKKHAPGATTLHRADRMLQYLWLSRVPTLILAKGETVLAVDPTDAELAGHVG